MTRKITFLFLLAIASVRAVAQKKNEQPNIIFFMVDDLGIKDLACYGSDLHQTPHIDKLAKQGMQFQNAYASCNVSSPTRASMMTGQYPARLHLTDWIDGWFMPYAAMQIPEWQLFLPAENYTLAEALRDNQYKTIHIGKWHLGEEEENWPLAHGFDVNKGGWKAGSPTSGGGSYFAPYKNPTLEEGKEGEYLTERLADEAILEIEKAEGKPFYLQLDFYNVHTPLQAKAEKVQKYEQLLAKDPKKRYHQNPTYAAMVEHVDDAVGKVLQRVEELGLADNTIIFLSGDNGGLQLGPKGPNKKGKYITNNYPYRSGKGDLYEGGVRVPFIVKWANEISENTHSAVPVITADVMPTILDMADASMKEKQPLDGISLKKVLTQEKAPKQRDLFWHYPHYHIQGAKPYSAILHQGWKYYKIYGEKAQLYRLSDDISEKNNVLEQFPEMVEKLEKRLEKWLVEVDAQMPKPNPHYDPKQKRKSKPYHSREQYWQ